MKASEAVRLFQQTALMLRSFDTVLYCAMWWSIPIHTPTVHSDDLFIGMSLYKNKHMSLESWWGACVCSDRVSKCQVKSSVEKCDGKNSTSLGNVVTFRKGKVI